MITWIKEFSARQIGELTGITSNTITYYLCSTPFAHIPREEKKMRYVKSGNIHKVTMYLVTNEDITALKDYKKQRTNRRKYKE